MLYPGHLLSQQWRVVIPPRDRHHCTDELISSEHFATNRYQPTADSHLPPIETLTDARAQLLGVFRKQFDQAALSRDSAAITRFFKLFPAAGWEKEGLEAYSDFVIDLVRSRPQASGKSMAALIAPDTSLTHSFLFLGILQSPLQCISLRP
jgi:hypothetical protein